MVAPERFCNWKGEVRTTIRRGSDKNPRPDHADRSNDQTADVADPIFADRRLAEIYDLLDPVRDDLDAYVALIDEFGATSVLDVGCGTGTLGCALADRGVTTIGVDPAEASLEVARGKPNAAEVTWVNGTAHDVPPASLDAATMTGNVAQVFLGDDQWRATLEGIRERLRPDGRLIFETRDPAAEAWRDWNRAASHRRVDIPDVGAVETWVELLDVSLPLVSFRWTFVFEADGAVVTSDSTLRFRHEAEVRESLATAGYVVDEVRDAPDRPGLEFVFVARSD